jgi:nucleoside-diphosphate-sugar epimerase
MLDMKDAHAPVLVTGATGYIASWIIAYLLEQGHTVHATVRNKAKQDRYAHLLRLQEKHPQGTLRMFDADLLKPGSFAEAMQGCGVVIHTASPFVVDQVADPQREIVDPAVQGTENVLRTASETPTVKRVVLTSSVVGIYGDPIDALEVPGGIFDESHWNTSSTLENGPYSYSKVAAERAAWDLAKQQQQWDLVVLNPGFVFGPSLTTQSESASVKFMQRLGDGTYRTGMPEIWTAMVDVRDVALAHVKAAFLPKASGRHVLVSGSLTFMDIVRTLKAKFGGKYKFPMMQAPKWLIYLMAPSMGVTRTFVKRNVGYPFGLNNAKSIRELGMSYRPMEQTLVEHFQQLIDDKML